MQDQGGRAHICLGRTSPRHMHASTSFVLDPVTRDSSSYNMTVPSTLTMAVLSEFQVDDGGL